MLEKFGRLKEKSTIAGFAGLLVAMLGIPVEYIGSVEQLLAAIVSAVLIAYGKKDDNTEVQAFGGTIDPIPGGNNDDGG